jgi:regulatory protein
LKITAVEPQKKDGRYNIFVDDQFWCGVSENTLAKFSIYPKKSVDKKFLDEVFEFEIFNKLYDGSIGKIARRPHSTWEIEKYISEKFWKNKDRWFSGSKYEADYDQLKDKFSTLVVKKLKKNKYLNDKDFVRWWIESRNRSRPRGWIALKSELLSKGVSEDIIKEFKLESHEEENLAKKLLKKITKNRQLSREKIISRMSSRGFSWDVINSVLPKDEMGSD